VKRVKEGQEAKVALTDGVLEGSVAEVASIAKPAGLWTGNQVRYDTYVSLPPREGLRPGRSAEVEIKVAKYENVLLIPVAAVVETEGGSFCWVISPQGARRRRITLGDSNEIFTIVTDGISEADEVLLNPAPLEQPSVEASESGETSLDEQDTIPTETSAP
jgi:HlyD family secretion protein